MSYRPKYLGHVNIYVRNAERSHQWYEDVLGLHTYDYMPGRAAFMSADQEQSHEVALIQVGDDAPLQQKGRLVGKPAIFAVQGAGTVAPSSEAGKTAGWI